MAAKMTPAQMTAAHRDLVRAMQDVMERHDMDQWHTVALVGFTLGTMVAFLEAHDEMGLLASQLTMQNMEMGRVQAAATEVGR